MVQLIPYRTYTPVGYSVAHIKDSGRCRRLAIWISSHFNPYRSHPEHHPRQTHTHAISINSDIHSLSDIQHLSPMFISALHVRTVMPSRHLRESWSMRLKRGKWSRRYRGLKLRLEVRNLEKMGNWLLPEVMMGRFRCLMWAVGLF